MALDVTSEADNMSKLSERLLHIVHLFTMAHGQRWKAQSGRTLLLWKDAQVVEERKEHEV